MTDQRLNMAANRKAVKYTGAEMVRRILWGMTFPLFRFSPRSMFSWRRFLLRLFGARIGEGVHIYNSATIYFPWNLVIGERSSIGEHAMIYNLGPVTIGANVTISQRSHLCAGTHDYNAPDMPLNKPPIKVEDNAWVCADAFVGPNVVVGEGTVVGARAVAVKSVEPWVIVVGNPARTIKKRNLEKD